MPRVRRPRNNAIAPAAAANASDIGRTPAAPAHQRPRTAASRNVHVHREASGHPGHARGGEEGGAVEAGNRRYEADRDDAGQEARGHEADEAVTSAQFASEQVRDGDGGDRGDDTDETKYQQWSVRHVRDDRQLDERQAREVDERRIVGDVDVGGRERTRQCDLQVLAASLGRHRRRHRRQLTLAQAERVADVRRLVLLVGRVDHREVCADPRDEEQRTDQPDDHDSALVRRPVAGPRPSNLHPRIVQRIARGAQLSASNPGVQPLGPTGTRAHAGCTSGRPPSTPVCYRGRFLGRRPKGWLGCSRCGKTSSLR